MRLCSIVVSLVGVVALVLGIVFIIQAGSSAQEVADSIQPVTLAELDSKYETVKAKQMDIRAAEEPQIQAGTVAPSSTYNYLTIQRTALGLARTNAGLAALVRTNGILDVLVGIGLVLAGVGLFKHSQSVS
jgi:hypothetical protein